MVWLIASVQVGAPVWLMVQGDWGIPILEANSEALYFGCV